MLTSSILLVLAAVAVIPLDAFLTGGLLQTVGNKAGFAACCNSKVPKRQHLECMTGKLRSENHDLTHYLSNCVHKFGPPASTRSIDNMIKFQCNQVCRTKKLNEKQLNVAACIIEQFQPFKVDMIFRLQELNEIHWDFSYPYFAELQ